MSCNIYDLFGSKLMSIKMKDRSFPIEWKHILMQNVDASKKSQNEGNDDQEQDWLNEDSNPVRNIEFESKDTKLVEEVYAKCNVAIVKHTNFDKVGRKDEWSIKKEKNMINKEFQQDVKRCYERQVVKNHKQNPKVDEKIFFEKPLKLEDFE